jgi:hypothetical protein
MYTSYRQQYTFGRVPFELKDLDTTTPAVSYLGAEEGDKSSAAGCTPIDLKAEDQMFALKARLDIKVLEALAGSGASATVTLYTCGDTVGTPNTPDTSNAKAILSFKIATADAIEASSMPWMEITMPSNCKRYVYLGIVLDDKTKAFSAGTILAHFNPNL